MTNYVRVSAFIDLLSIVISVYTYTDCRILI